MPEIVTASPGELVPLRLAPAPRRRGVVAVWARAWRFLGPAQPHTYLDVGERCLVVTHLHWLVPARTVAQSLVSVVAGVALGFVLPAVFVLQVALGLVATAHWFYMVYLLLAWRADLIVVTDRRLIRVSGVVSTTINDVTRGMVTDRSFHRSVLGHILGYGELRVETPGRQHRSLELVRFLPRPEVIYRASL